MKILWYNFEVDGSTDYRTVFFTGDWHYGTSCCNKGCVNACLDKVKHDKNNRVVLMGDLGDFILYKDRRFAPQILDPNMPSNCDIMDWTVNKLSQVLQPVRGKVIGMLTGNHEEKAVEDYHVNPTDVLAEKVGSVNLGYSGFILLRFRLKGTARSRVVRVFVHHGYGAGHSRTNKVEKIYKLAGQYEADVYAMGHVHELHASFYPTLSAVGERHPRLLAKNKHFILTGSCLNAHLPDAYDLSASTYVERAAYPPVALGWVELKIWPWQGKHGDVVIEATAVPE